MTQDQTHLLNAVRAAAGTVTAAEVARLETMQQIAEDSQKARQARAEAIRAADDAGIPRQLIAEAAGLAWPMSRQRWSQLRHG